MINSYLLICVKLIQINRQKIILQNSRFNERGVMETMIEARNLRRDFKKITAVRDVSFAINEGEIFGLLGHNGAGKTTTIRMLTGQLRPTSGEGTIDGFDIATEQNIIKPLIGVVFDSQNLYERMTGRENLNLFADLYEIKRYRVQELIELIRLQHRSNEKIETYSNGMKQRVLIARALLHNPKIIFLDEPTRGLDPTSAREIRDTIKALAKAGVTIFLTTHYMEEADELCNRVAFIENGEIVALDTPHNLKLKYGERRVIATITEHEKKSFSLVDPNDIQQLASLMSNGIIQTIHSQEAALEDVFIKLAGRELEK